MRLKALALAVAVIALAAPAGASAAAKIGISENNPQMFSDPNFLALGAKHSRIVVSYNAVTAAALGDNEISSRVQPYLASAGALGIDPLVTFEHARGAAEVCKRGGSQPQCKLPSDAEYEANLRAFLTMFPSVKTIAPWNEANHNTQPTYRNPASSARFAKIAERVCTELNRGCTIVALDLLDQADNVKAKKPKYKSLTKWVKKWRKAYGKKPSICGLHSYSDINRFRMTGTKAMIKATKCRQYWLTESGGLYDFGSFWKKSTRKQYKCKNASACQLKATKFMFKLLRKYKAIKRAYIHSYYGSHAPRFDAGMVTGAPGQPTKPRKAYKEIKKRI